MERCGSWSVPPCLWPSCRNQESGIFQVVIFVRCTDTNYNASTSVQNEGTIAAAIAQSKY